MSCRPVDIYGRSLVTDLTKLVVTTDARIIAARNSFYHVPVVPVSSIALVSDEHTCKKAAQALTKSENSPSGKAKDRTVVVSSLGSFWAVEDPDARPDGRFLTVVIFDAKWKPVGGYTGP